MKLYENTVIPDNCSIALDHNEVIMRVSLNITKEVYNSGLIPKSLLTKGRKHYVFFNKHILKPEELNPEKLHFRYRAITYNLMATIRRVKASLLTQEARQIENMQLSLFS